MGFSSWSAPFADGWYPRLSPDGRYLLCGNASARVVEIATKQTVVVPGGRFISQGWLSPVQAMVANDGGLYRLDAPTFSTPVKIGPRLPFAGCGNNIWAGGTTRQIWTGDSDGHAVNIAPGYAATVGEDGFVVYAVSDGHLVVGKSGQIQRTITTSRATNSFRCGPRGYVGYGYNGPSWLNTPSGEELEVGVTPDKHESAPLAFLHLGAIWLITTSDRGTFLRPLGVRNRTITIEGPATDSSVVSLGDKFLVATATATGRLTLTEVPANAPLLPVPGPIVPPMTAKATIDSFDNPIRLGQKSRAVARVTAGKPERFRWQWQDGHEWRTQADNPASDLDHHYSFSAVGTYAIRLQTLQAGVVTDTSSSTSRTVTVLPLIPEPEPEPTPPPVPGPGEVVLHLTDMQSVKPIQGADAWAQVSGSEIKTTDANGYAVVSSAGPGVCVKKAGYHSPGLPAQDHTCVPLSADVLEMVLERIPPPPPPTPLIHAAGKIFRDNTNQPWRYKGVSAFALCDRYTKGQDIRPFLDAYAGFNVLRVWAYTDWAGTGWARPQADQILDFVDAVGQHSGTLVEWTWLTNDSLEASDWAGGMISNFRGVRMLHEIRNEPETHSKQTPTSRLKAAFDAAGVLYASGNYEVSAHAFGGYLVAHTARDSEWPRKAHDLMEYYNGKGPHQPSDPAHKVPCVADEPAKWEDVDQFYKDGIVSPDDWRAYFGTAALLGAGATFHSETGKWAQVPTALEAQLAAAALEGLDAFPADAPNGTYTRPSDQSLRTYVIDNKYMVRVRPTTDAPSGGWTRIGASRVLWRK